MPYRSEWVPAELALEHKGVRVYHTYRNDEMEAGAKIYWFVLDAEDSFDDAFDVRDLAVPREVSDPFERLRTAVDLGLLPFKDEDIATDESRSNGPRR
jgi:hypothetical protein